MSPQDIKKSQKNRKRGLIHLILPSFPVQILYILSGIGLKINNPEKRFCHITKYSQICHLNKTLTIWKKSELPL